MSRGAAFFWSVLMIGAAVMLAVGCLSGCPRPAPPVIAPVPDGYKPCPNGNLPVAEDVCERRFTADGFACVKCKPPLSGCYIQIYSSYCVISGNCADSICRLDPGP